MDLGIKGRSAIVTGGSRGIGRETARQFLEEGVRVTICGRNKDTLEKTRDELAKATGGEIQAVVADTTKEADLARLVEAAKQKFGAVDILVNNAGQMYSGRFAAMTDAGLKEQFETKIFGFLRAIRLVHPIMKARRWGRIVNFASLQSRRAFPGGLAYGASKGGVEQLTRAMAEAWSACGITVNALAPGFFPTELTGPVFSDPELAARNAAQTCIGRNGELSDLHGPLLFFCSEASAYVTGQTLFVDGGFTAK